jgi:dTDP-4-dehydrorhamnose 3,5-epimerase-like enzyme
MDIYSKPINEVETKLSKIFEMKPRKSDDKPGRSLSVLWDVRSRLIPEFENNYDYLVTFDKKGEKAGNHYHDSKQELFIPVVGQVKILLEDTNTKEKEEFTLNSKDNKILYVKPNVAHTVVSDSDISALLVIASFPNNLMDEKPYEISE